MTIRESSPPVADVTDRGSRTATGSESTRPGDSSSYVLSSAAAKSLAVLRIALGFVFLWAFFDKLFGLHYSTPSANAWVSGGSPTKGFLSSVDVGPFQSLFQSFAGAGWANWLFMAGLLGIGVAMVLGIAMRAAAAAGALLLIFMWFAAYPLAQFSSAGEATRSTNPLVDDHIINAVALVVVALCGAGATWGLGKQWARIPFVANHSWTR